MLLRRRSDFTIAEREVTPESLWLTRRALLGSLVAAGLISCRESSDGAVSRTIPRPASPFPAPRSSRFRVDGTITEELVAATYNNFYDFSAVKDRVWQLAERLDTRGWTLEVAGLVRSPKTFDMETLHRLMPLEERVYRLRCVEAWSMIIPWTGFPLHRLLALVEPLSTARFVRFETFHRPWEAEAQKSELAYPWPYVEALRLDEAMNDLTMLVTGVYGHALPAQHGAPIRLVVPWKYGFKSAKSLVRITLSDEQPPTFWNIQAPAEYSFLANVDPTTPHPRWSQRTERLIGTWDVRRTVAFNGYASAVAGMYGGSR